jgi:peptide/nickel transport system substrate-binding protein
MSFRFAAPLSLVLLGCGGPTAPSGSGGAATASGGAPAASGGAGAPAAAVERRDSLVVALLGDVGSLMPVVSESNEDDHLMNMVGLRLIDAAFDCSIKKQPGLATEWAWSDDGKVLSMTLRDDLTWEDGKPVTAADVAFTYELIQDPIVASPRAGFTERMVDGKAPLVLDPTHIEWHFTEAYDRDSQIGHTGAMIVMPKHKLEGADRAALRKHPMRTTPLSYGPYRVNKWDPGQRIVLTPNEAFTGTAAEQSRLNRIVFRFIPEYATRLLSLEQGDVDMAMGLRVEDADRLRKEHPEIKLERRGMRSMDYIAWNLKNPLFKDVRVRRAFAHAVDVDGMIGKMFTSDTGEAYAQRAVGTITPELCGVHNDDIVPIPFELEQAKSLMQQAGWTDSDGDGVLDKDGKPFKFTLTTNGENARRQDIQVLVQAQLKQLGVEVQLATAESNTFFERLRKRNFDAAVAGWAAALFVDPSDVWHSDLPDHRMEFNFTSYSDPAADALIEKGLATPEPREAAPIWKDLQKEIYEDQPYMFLWWMDEIVGIHERFENTEVDLMSPLNHVQRWSVPADKVKRKR